MGTRDVGLRDEHFLGPRQMIALHSRKAEMLSDLPLRTLYRTAPIGDPPQPCHRWAQL